MSVVVTVPDALSDTLAATVGRVDLRTADGRRLGWFIPDPRPAPPADPPSPAAENPDPTPPKPQTMADTFAGRVGRVRGKGDGRGSVNTGEQFTDYLVQKRREGRL